MWVKMQIPVRMKNKLFFMIDSDSVVSPNQVI